MAQDNDSRKIVGLDIGTNKVVAIVGEANRDGELEILGIGSHQSRGALPSGWTRRSEAGASMVLASRS